MRNGRLLPMSFRNETTDRNRTTLSYCQLLRIHHIQGRFSYIESNLGVLRCELNLLVLMLRSGHLRFARLHS